jgi:xanthine dehydrogenase YagS FAD-binding subunit
MKDRTALPERLWTSTACRIWRGLKPCREVACAWRTGEDERRAANMEVHGRFPVVAKAPLFAASSRPRNMATIGGNIMQSTRCAYFRDETDDRCNKLSQGSGCAALHGLNRNHAIFGWSESCVAINPSDLAVALAALDAVVIVRGQTGERLIPLTGFHRLPGGAPERSSVLDRGDLIAAIEIPAAVEGRDSSYLKVRDRQSYEFDGRGEPHSGAFGSIRSSGE